MKNIFANFSDRTKGILLIIGGSLLVLNYFGFIEILNSALAIGGLIMIVAGILMARLHEKVYLLIAAKKDNDDDQMNDPDRGF